MEDNKKLLDNQGSEQGEEMKKAEADFQNKVFDVFSKKMPGVHRDENGFIVLPVVRRKS